eukprot:CAMPEP_0170596484 /NCGR_PEP_ID=MMETSP0224-20130122/15150_1 /TAXON_ID=285029 /ORGANISM="Togula jolla, Strain CCCM 725" /LENGTH=102 /DNA_ID=CAMNT_0010920795 /DNA_START=102 /DNA_END=410 /DNA_ORIENTATION=-
MAKNSRKPIPIRVYVKRSSFIEGLRAIPTTRACVRSAGWFQLWIFHGPLQAAAVLAMLRITAAGPAAKGAGVTPLGTIMGTIRAARTAWSIDISQLLVGGDA